MSNTGPKRRREPRFLLEVRLRLQIPQRWVTLGPLWVPPGLAGVASIVYGAIHHLHGG